MVIALPVYHPDAPDHLLLQPGFKLNGATIERMKQLGVDQLWVRYPALEQIERRVNPAVIRARAELAGHIRQAFDSIQNQCLAHLDYNAYTLTISKLIEQLLTHPASVICLGSMFAQGRSLMNHCLRVTYISVLMGAKLDAYLIRERPRLLPRRAKEIHSLGLGAMLHDVGLLLLPTETRDVVPYSLLNADTAWRAHVEPNNQALLTSLPATVRAVVAQHHQHFDGSGFPRTPNSAGQVTGMSGHDIHIFARIVTVANTFDRLQASLREKPLPSVVVLNAMLSERYRSWFDPTVLGALLSIMPAYSPGAMVTLNNGRKAVVVAHHAEDSCRPTIQWHQPIAADGDERSIDLREHDDLHVTHIGDQNVESFNFKAAELQLA